MFLPQNLPNSLLSHKQSGTNIKMTMSSNLENNSNLDNIVRLSKPSSSLVTRSWARLSKRARKKRRDTALVNNEDSTASVTNVSKTTISHSETANNAEQNNSTLVTRDIEAHSDFLRKQKSGVLLRGMDKLRRSFRKSFRRNKDRTLNLSNSNHSENRHDKGKHANCVETTGSIHNGKTYCQPDEAAVRSAACSFSVKYLGACEVFESRGMHVCESALQQLRTKKRVTKAILYVTGDGIRVVDQENNHGLILDQTIEKVSFCAPDRNNDKGFAYICRDGATKRWMCHGFQSTKESGERLSHAVGCAFTICLEKKRKRDAEMTAYRNGQILSSTVNGATESRNFNNASSVKRGNLEYGSFRRQLSMMERKLDPQTAIINHPLPSSEPPNLVVQNGANSNEQMNIEHNRNSLDFSDSAMVKPRPVANFSLFERQGSFKVLSQPINSFKRFNSLRTDNSTLNRLANRIALNKEPIYEGDDESCSAELLTLNFNNAFPDNFVTNNTFSVPSQNLFNAISHPVSSQISPNPSNELTTGNGPPRTQSNYSCNNKAEEWLRQVLSTSKTNLSSIGDSFSDITGAVYANKGVPMTPSNSFVMAPPLYTTLVSGVSHSFSATFPSQSTPTYPTLPTTVTVDNISSICGPPPNQPPPPLPPFIASSIFAMSSNQKNCKNELNKVEESITSKTSSSVSIVPRTNTSSNKQFNNKEKAGCEDPRKTSNPRMSIEYQLLEETDAPPQSPQNSPVIRNSPPLPVSVANLILKDSNFSRKCKENDASPSSFFLNANDPFDVKWSAEVLQKSVLRKSNVHTQKSDMDKDQAITNKYASFTTPNNMENNDLQQLRNNIDKAVITATPITTNNPFFYNETAPINV